MKVAIIGCGGTGINWTKQVLDTVIGKSVDIDGSDVEVLIVDGSDSNIRLDTLPNDVQQWICPNTDGAGMQRSLCVKPYKEFLASRIHELPEADLYIVMYSITGGTGSVFGPDITLHLLKQGKAVVNLSTLSTASKSAAENGNRVVRGLASYARKAGKPVVTFLQNGDNLSTQEVDTRARAAVEALVYAASSSLGDMDTSDMRAFLDYTRHGLEPTLTELVLTPEVEEIRKDPGKYLTTLSVIPDREADEPNVDELINLVAVGGSLSLYFGTRIDRISEMVTHIANRDDHYQSLAKSHTATSVFDDDEEMEY